jgi:hypothetical protein
MPSTRHDTVFQATVQVHAQKLASRMQAAPHERPKDPEKDELIAEMSRTYALLDRFYGEAAADAANKGSR